jgi:hypothetical protein
MSAENQSKPTNPHDQAVQGVVVELTPEELQNLAGWFDTLIQMDQAQKIRNELRSKDEQDVISKTVNKLV